ncbi:hypothetical protein EV368DRAFT_85829 [Lentinula lateritia]|nr:hypothetical protein EV368DRAFT_85829 [Lentinula lateritia]
MGSGITLFHKLLAACILLVGSLGVIASPVVISGDSLSARHLIAPNTGRWTQKNAPVSLFAGLAVDENQQISLVFREKDSTEFQYAFMKNADGIVNYKKMDEALQQQVKPFVLNSVGHVPTFLVFISDDKYFLTESTKGAQGAQWVKEAVEQLMLRHNSLRLNFQGKSRPDAFDLEGEGDARKPIYKLIDSMGTRGKDSSKP